MRPDALIVRAYLTRGLIIWVGARLLVSAIIALAGANPLDTTPGTVLGIVVCATILAVAQTTRLRESILLGNLRISPLMLASMLAIPAAIGELFVRLLRGVLS